MPQAALPAIDALLRLVAARLLADEDTTRHSVDAAAVTAARSVPVAPARAAMAYLRDRVGVPRDADHPVAHEMRCGLNWMCKVLLSVYLLSKYYSALLTTGLRNRSAQRSASAVRCCLA